MGSVLYFDKKSPPLASLLRGRGGFKKLRDPDSFSASGSIGSLTLMSKVTSKLSQHHCRFTIRANVRDSEQAVIIVLLIFIVIVAHVKRERIQGLQIAGYF